MISEKDYYQLYRDKIDLNDISTWKYFPVGEAMRKTYDYHNLNLKDYLERYYKVYNNRADWDKWMRGIILPLYKNEITKWKRYNVDFKNNEYILWFEEKHIRVSNSFLENKSITFFEEDIILFMSYLESFDFFQDINMSIENWSNIKNFNVAGKHKVESDIYSLQEMSKEKYGNNLVRDKLMTLEWHKK